MGQFRRNPTGKFRVPDERMPEEAAQQIFLHLEKKGYIGAAEP